MVGGVSGVQMKIKLLGLLSVLQRHEALPIPTQACWGKLYVLHILPVSFFHSHSRASPWKETQMRSIWRNEDSQDKSGKSSLEPKLPKAAQSGRLAHCCGPGLRRGNPTAGMILRAKELFLVPECFYLHDSTWSTPQPQQTDQARVFMRN